METEHGIYKSPFAERWSSDEMLRLFSDDTKFRTWRRLWIALAKAEKALGLPITDAQIAELEKNRDNINYEDAKRFEKETRHDVMAHIKAYGLQCPEAKGIIHLGATSCYVGDNTDIILMRDGLLLLRKKLLTVIKNLAAFADKYKAMPTLGFTHFQPAQLTTVGKRACLWINDLMKDVEELDFRVRTLKMRGVKGTTGSQASFLDLFGGDGEKVKLLERAVISEFGFDAAEPVTGQTYSRKTDYGVISALAGIAQSASKFATDIRLLQSQKEIEEPFETSQVGSSAMPYKRNPMRCERICGISRFLIALTQNPASTEATQWLERTLDDSSNRRLSIPEAFLAADAILGIYANVSAGLVVYPKVIAAHVARELPFMASENIMMEAVKAGGDRQALHERIRVHAQAAGRRVKEEGLDNDLLARISGDPAFRLSESDIERAVNPSAYIGRCPEQVDEFLNGYVYSLIKDADFSGESFDLKV
jgi:adenylosuccinate lyase